MSTLNQNMIIASLDKALVPSPYLVDGRTELDWLSFITDFASLINFYDSSNQVNGNWKPFLLKDPIVLLASISKTNVTKLYTLYLQTCSQLDYCFKNNTTSNIAHLFNSLFDQLFRLYTQIERWMCYMSKSNEEYDLKKYLFYQVENVYAPQLWALLSLRKELFLNKIIVGLESFESTIFDNTNQTIWKINKNQRPYWEILHLNKTLLVNKIADFFNAIKTAGDQLFIFFNTIIQHAKEAFENLKEKRGKFPDTILMRTFVHLLMHYKDQLNEISQKHLNFYYTDILKQKIKYASPDSVFVSIELGKKDAVFHLPKETLFDAGMDAQKKPIVFASLEKVSLNPAVIVSAKTMTILQTEGIPQKLYLQNIATPSTLQKDETGKVQGWPIFGGNKPPISASITLGFAFASPLLLLREGTRNIQITLCFEKEGAFDFLNTAQYYLSTQAAWFPVKFSIAALENSSANILLTLKLDNTQPPIEAFTINPDGYASLWPLLKIELDSVENDEEVPVLKSIEVTVSVNNIANLELYNDYGGLDAKNPFQLFGPAPLVNNNFIIGSNEILSKPLQSLHIDMTWDTLPSDFQTYYQEYNNYIGFLVEKIAPGKQLVQIEDTPKNAIQKMLIGITHAATKIVKGAVKKVLDLIVELLKEILELVRGILDIEKPNATTPFNNVCFTVDFKLLNNNSWEKINMVKEGVKILEDKTIVPIPYEVNTHCNPKANETANLLFSTTNQLGDCKLTDKSFFSYNIVPLVNATAVVPTIPVLSNPFAIDFVKKTVATTPDTTSIHINPNIQNTPLIYTDKSTTGFIKMTLTGPTTYGFGSELYPEVVANIALQNALQISKDPKIDPKKLLSPAKLPFAPKLKTLLAHYTASQMYDITKTGNYPIQCFTYSPFVTYLTYDNTGNIPVYNYNVGDQKIIHTLDPAGVPLFSSLHNYKGFLYIELTNVVAPNEINFYIELGRKEGNIPTDTKPDYYYLGTMGWQPLPLLSDGTNNLSCSGIITFNIPKDISKQGIVMPDKNYWICLATKSEISNYPDITFLKTNGVLLTRSGTEFLSGISEPKIDSDVISKSHATIPEIATTVQPFPSFGGKAMEDDTLKNKRVSNRLKTKDRMVSIADYFRIIQEEFNDIYYSKTIFSNKTTQVYLVGKCLSATDFNAFAPMITPCKEEKIQKYLTERASAFSNIQVSNFVFLYVTINATIVHNDDYAFEGVQKTVEASLNLFLSPWISTNNPQIIIDEPLTDIMVINFMKTIQGVADVKSLTFSTFTTASDGTVTSQTELSSITLDQNPALLIVSSLNHCIDENA